MVLFVFSLVVFASFTAAAFAEEVKGSIESIYASQNTIVVSDQLSGMNKTVIVSSKVIPTLKKGSFVRASMQSGSNTAETLDVVVG